MSLEEEIQEMEAALEELKRKRTNRPTGNSATAKDILRYLIDRPEKFRATTKIMAAFNMTYATFAERMYHALGKGWVTKERKTKRVVWTITDAGLKKLKEE